MPTAPAVRAEMTAELGGWWSGGVVSVVLYAGGHRMAASRQGATGLTKQRSTLRPGARKHNRNQYRDCLTSRKPCAPGRNQQGRPALTERPVKSLMLRIWDLAVGVCPP